MYYPDFLKLFEDGRVLDSEEFGRVTLRQYPAGYLVMTTGRVVVSDSDSPPEAPPRATPFPPGRHPLLLSIAHFEDGTQWIAGAMVGAGPRPPVRWVALLRPGESTNDFREGVVEGFGAAAGSVSLMDVEAGERLTASLDVDESILQHIADVASERHVDNWSWASAELDPATGLNIIFLITGFGSGLRGIYVGLDEAGNDVALVIDFAIFGYEFLI